MAVDTLEQPQIDPSKYLALPAALELGVIREPHDLVPRPLDDAVALLDAGHMPRQAGLVIARTGEIAALDLVNCEFIGDDQEMLIVHPGDKTDVTKIEKRIRVADADILMSTREGLMWLFARTVALPPETSWGSAGQGSNLTTGWNRDASNRSKTYAHRRQRNMTVELNDEETTATYQLEDIGKRSGIIYAQRIA